MVLTAIGQICSTASMTHNLSQCQVLIRRAVAAGAKALFLPEASDYIASSPAESIALCLPVRTSPFVRGLQEAAKDHRLAINVGVHEPTDPPGKRIKNTLLWINRDGEIAHRYQKVHLFDIDLRPEGPEMKESDSIQAGDVIEEPFEVEGLIDLAAAAAARVASAIVSQCVHGADGEDALGGAVEGRAVESQCWVVASAQCGRHNGKRVSYGESLVVDPRGVVVERLERVEDVEKEREGQRSPGLLLVDVGGKVVDVTRKMIPLESLRRTDVYPEI